MKKWFVFFGLILCLTTLVSGKIIFYSDYDDTFNVGDVLPVNISVTPVESGKGYLDIYLNCNDDELLVHREYSNFISSTVYSKFFSFPVSMKGDCFLKASFRDESQKSDSFVISNNVSISYVLNRVVFSPGEIMIFNGTARKGNGEGLNGSLDLKISGIIEKTIDVTQGKFYYNFSISNSAPSGKYEFTLYAYDEDSEGVLNSGKDSGSIEIISKPTFLNIYSREIVNPPANFSFNVALFDQGNNLMPNKTIQVKLVDSSLNPVFDKVVLNNETIYYFFPSNALIDSWNIRAYYGNISSFMPIYVGANSEVRFDYIVNEGKLRAENVGNVKYENVISYTIFDGNFSKEIPINISLEVGKSEDYSLVSGRYNLSIGGRIWENVEVAEITAAVVFSDIKISKNSCIISFLIILGFIILGILFRNRKRIKNFFSSSEERKFLKEEKIKIIKREKPRDKKIYSVFLSVDSFTNKMESLAKRNELYFRKYSDTEYFYVFISSNLGKETQLLDFSRELQKLNSRSSILVHSKLFDGKVNSMKNFALGGKKLFLFVQGRGIVLSKNIFESLGMGGVNFREFRVDEEIIKVAFLK